MARFGTRKPDITPDEVEQLKSDLTAVDPDVVYLGHHYGRDDWHGTGTPYRSLAAAIRHESDMYDDWVDSVDLYPCGTTVRGTLWWPTTEDGEPFTPDGDSHPYIQKAQVKS